MTRDGRTRGEGAPRSATDREWEVFVRETDGDPLKHVGSITAADADTAHEHASQLFDWTARDVWLCPADETRRYTTQVLGEDEDSERESEFQDDAAANAGEDAVTTESGGESA